MTLKKIAFVLAFGLLFKTAFSQAPLQQNQEKISGAITSYFKLDRENIHLHLNKTQYLTSDKIWLKGYITEKKTGLPYEMTSNVLVNLLDQSGKKIKSYLFYAENSTFEGTIKLDPNYTTGVYYLQVFTNYMNNFTEDESSRYKIYILNPTENKKVGEPKINYDAISITFSPESGVLLEGVTNTVAVRVKDCNNNGIAVKEGTVTDSKGNVITNFSTNTLGYGKFDILVNHNETYRATISANGKLDEKVLPQPQLNGITFAVNNYTFADKTVFKIKTNPRTLKSIATDNYSMVIQKNNTATYVEFSFENKAEKTISVPNELFSPGINTIYLLDKNLSEIGQRIIYKQPYANTKMDFKIARTANDSIHIKGLSTLPLAELSISVLPENGLFDNNEQTIYTSKVFNDLQQIIPNAAYFLNDFSKKKHFELDNLLIAASSKYQWRNILLSAPKESHEFDFGLSIKGKINTDLTDKNTYKVNMTSTLLGLNEFTSVNDKNEFYFKNLLASDSTKIYFSLLNKKAKQNELKMVSTVTNNKRTFSKSFQPESTSCPSLFEDASSSDDKFFPSIANTILLDSITINAAKKKPVLTNNLRYSNNMSKGYKISEKDANSFRDVLQFIASHGYDVSTEAGTVTITARTATSILGTRTPLVYLDDSPVEDFNLLLNYSLMYVDEIYVNKRGFGGGLNANNGIIRIYSKKGIDALRTTPRIKSGSLIVENGFQPLVEFTTPKYTSFSNKGFTNYGTINWIPKVSTDQAGEFLFSFPNLYQEKVQVIIEGMSSDGQFISEIRTIEIPQ